ncbi:MAG: D,D-heptose 1,7-bisphosphate phosphatase [Gemmatales bacterium]|nr:MAG: D,D-heptose 1,7-bisphosphate phosphatase [Gemmatales bacterium]
MWRPLKRLKEVIRTFMNRAVFLDRDGVINRVFKRDGKPYPPPTLADFEFLPGVVDAVAAFRRAGFRVIVVTNQPDVATGKQTRSVVEAMHAHVRQALAVDDIKVCFHTDADLCDCRKPKPGMLLSAAQEWSLQLEQSYMIGDRWRDIDAGRAARCKTIWIRHDYDERLADHADAIVDSLWEASQLILSERI